MNERTYTTVDKTPWGEGPWLGEPDKVQWRDDSTGLPCLAVRNRLGSWCGYVGVAPGHPAHGRRASELDDEGVEAHGGVNYADHCQDGPEDAAICHVPDPGEPDHVWWFGFDCGHFFDRIPAMEADHRRRYEETGDPLWRDICPEEASYKTLDYVRAEVTALAGQLAALPHDSFLT